LGLVFPSAESSFNDRLHFSLEVAGLIVSALGSALFIGANLPPLWFMVLTLLAVTAVVYWLLASLALKYWRVRLNDAVGLLRADPRNPLVQWQLDCMRLCASWRWVLRHPFERDHWPASCQRPLGPVPAGIAGDPHELREEQLLRLEQGASLSQQIAVPDAIRDIVDACDREGWQVAATGSAVAFYSPSGHDPVVISKADVENDPRGLLLQWLLAELTKRGLSVKVTG
jgi:hypothetical protein